MTAVDTNVVVRALVRDDPAQAKRADAALADGPIWLAKSVLLETEWVLRSAYALDRSTVNRAIVGLVGLEGTSTEDYPTVVRALGWHLAGLDFADALHLASAGPARELATFDRRLAAISPEDAPVVRLL